MAWTVPLGIALDRVRRKRHPGVSRRSLLAECAANRDKLRHADLPRQLIVLLQREMEAAQGHYRPALIDLDYLSCHVLPRPEIRRTATMLVATTARIAIQVAIAKALRLAGYHHLAGSRLGLHGGKRLIKRGFSIRNVFEKSNSLVEALLHRVADTRFTTPAKQQVDGNVERECLHVVRLLQRRDIPLPTIGLHAARGLFERGDDDCGVDYTRIIIVRELYQVLLRKPQGDQVVLGRVGHRLLRFL